jgi:hypothetical protein
MAYSAFTPETEIQEAQDATALRIWDKSIWTGESGNTTFCEVRITHYDVDDVATEYDPYELITGVDTTKFDEYLSDDGHIIEIADLTIDSLSAGERFEDGYYLIKVVYSEGSYAEDLKPYYDNTQAFLAKARCKARKLPTKLSWPLTDVMYRINRDIFSMSMYLQAAEDAADLGKESQYRTLIDIINNIFDTYEIESCF